MLIVLEHPAVTLDLLAIELSLELCILIFNGKFGPVANVGATARLDGGNGDGEVLARDRLVIDGEGGCGAVDLGSAKEVFSARAEPYPFICSRTISMLQPQKGHI